MDQSTIIRFQDLPHSDAPARLDIYGPVHKGLRAFMFDTLTRIGATDARDGAQVATHLGQTRQLLAALRAHLHHENRFLHAAIEARRPGASQLTADDHIEHENAIVALEAAVAALAQTPPSGLAQPLYRFYLQLARFVAENVEHMEIEETHNTAVLRELYTDDEIGAIVQDLLASIDPQAVAIYHRWMYGAMTHDERVGMLGAIRAGAPAAVFQREVDLARDVLQPRDFAKLARALGVPAVPGLVELW